MSTPEGLASTPFSARYPAAVEEWIDVYGFAVPLWLSDPDREYDAIRNRVALLEYSMLYKWYVAGPGAVATVDAVFSRDVAALAADRLAYGVVVSEAGTMLDDVTVARLGPELVLVTGGNPATEAALRAHARPGTEVAERRDELAVLSVQGPRSRELLAAVTDVDVSNAAFPYYTVRTDVSVAGIPTTVSRVGFTAELGYELIVPVDRALELWDALVTAGEGLGVEPIGAAALMMARVEGGMIMGELEYDDTVSPWECRMGWAVDLGKGPFQGREALAARQDRDTGRVVTVRLEAAPEVAEGAELLLDGDAVGHVTMAVPSPASGGATIGLARVHRAGAAVGTRLVARTGSGDVAAEVRPTPLYDPERTRAKG